MEIYTNKWKMQFQIWKKNFYADKVYTRIVFFTKHQWIHQSLLTRGKYKKTINPTTFGIIVYSYQWEDEEISNPTKRKRRDLLVTASDHRSSLTAALCRHRNWSSSSALFRSRSALSNASFHSSHTLLLVSTFLLVGFEV